MINRSSKMMYTFYIFGPEKSKFPEIT